MKPSNTRAIIVSMGGNIGISVAKFLAAAFTGSAAMMAEAVHALVDITHELLLLLGVRQAQAPADDRFPYGQGKAIYFWGLIAVIFFTVGGAFAVFNGVEQLLHPQPVETSWIAYAILVIALVLNSVALVEALQQFVRTKGSVPFLAAMRGTKDPSMRILIFQNGLDIVGELLVICGMLLFQLTGNLYFDAVAGMAIGIMLVVAALWQAAQIKSLLIGESADEHIIQGIRELAKSHPEIRDVEEISTLHMGPECIVVNLRARFVDATYAYEIDQVTHSLERGIGERFPLVKFVYVKAVVQNNAGTPSMQLLGQEISLADRAT
ncbi:MAG: cation transporter [Thermomicrobiales bacterium]|nr:MAG: cation transporter [Thermomicrobiales bacterium]